MGGLFLREMEALNTMVSSDVMSWIYLTLVFARNVVYNDLFFFFLGGEIRNGNHKLTTRSKWLPLQEKTAFFFSSAYLTHCSFMNFSFFFFFLNLVKLPWSTSPSRSGNQTWLAESLWSALSFCLSSTSCSSEPSAVSFEAGSNAELVDLKVTQISRSTKTKVAALLVLKRSTVVNSISYGLTVFIVCKGRGQRPSLNVRCSVLSVFFVSLVYEKWLFRFCLSNRHPYVPCARVSTYSQLLLRSRAAGMSARLPPLKLSWRAAFQWAGCCRARRRSGVCSRGTPLPAGWSLGSPAAGGAAGRTCPFAEGSCTWRSPGAPRWPAPGRFLPGESSPGFSHLQEERRRWMFQEENTTLFE